MGTFLLPDSARTAVRGRDPAFFDVVLVKSANLSSVAGLLVSLGTGRDNDHPNLH